MSPWILRVLLAAAANAVTLLVAAALFDRISVDAVTFLVAVAIFTAAALVVKPIAERLAGEYASSVTWVAGLATTYLALLITDVLSRGLSIEGIGTWIMGTIVVWIGTLIYDIVDDRLIAGVGRRLAGPRHAG
jgi:putative membrane protein